MRISSGCSTGMSPTPLGFGASRHSFGRWTPSLPRNRRLTRRRRILRRCSKQRSFPQKSGRPTRPRSRVRNRCSPAGGEARFSAGLRRTSGSLQQHLRSRVFCPSAGRRMRACFPLQSREPLSRSFGMWGLWCRRLVSRGISARSRCTRSRRSTALGVMAARTSTMGTGVAPVETSAATATTVGALRAPLAARRPRSANSTQFIGNPARIALKAQARRALARRALARRALARRALAQRALAQRAAAEKRVRRPRRVGKPRSTPALRRVRRPNARRVILRRNTGGIGLTALTALTGLVRLIRVRQPDSRTTSRCD